ncbi:ceramide transfer protein-like [Oscarella lobularis]|uniref:ceramide transfer protein-like n=1 Tax=Oscarella lobularis TaxID=121494 RepID=UPI003313E205
MCDPSSDDLSDDDCVESRRLPEHRGRLSKWTNFFHGWQDRWLVLSNGTLSYYKSADDMEQGCRGSMAIQKNAVIKAHEFDDARFDIAINESVFYLRAANSDERKAWLDALEATKKSFSESAYASETSLHRYDSRLSIASTYSQQSSSSLTRTQHLREKLYEMETYRDILCKQVDVLQSFFDSCSEIASNGGAGGENLDTADASSTGTGNPLSGSATPTSLPGSPSIPHKETNAFAVVAAAVSKGLVGNVTDFKGEATTFKATTAGILASLSNCIDMMNKREEQWKQRLKKEKDRRQRMDDEHKIALAHARKGGIIASPDYEEGPHSALNDEEFFDAVEIALDHEDAIEEKRIPHPIANDGDDVSDLEYLTPNRLSEMVEERIQENLKFVYERVDQFWSLVHEDGDMKIYRRDLEEGGVVLDPLKAQHTIPGITARELCQYFFDKDCKKEYDATIDTVRILEKLNRYTTIYHQLHKRVWPSSQRDTCFVSHMRPVKPHRDFDVNGESHGWMVCNFSIDHDQAPSNKYIRCKINVALVAFTFIQPREAGTDLTRDDITCKLTYSAHINPGGWAPAAAVRQVSKRETPKFLRRISSLAQNSSAGKSIAL